MKAKRTRRAPQQAARPSSVPQPPTIPPSAWFAAIFTGAFALRLFHVLQIRGAPFFSLLMGDSRSYDRWAQTIAGGNWIGGDVFYQAPLYPYFLGVIYTLAGRDLMAVRMVQAVLGSISCVLIAHAAWRLFGRRAGIVAGAIAALYPTSIFFDGLLQKTALDGFLTSLALWIVSGILTRPSGTSAWLALGLVMGALSLTRENALALAVVLIIWGLIPGLGATQEPAGLRSRVSRAAAFTLGLSLLLVPVAIRNAMVGGGFHLTTSQFGPNLYLGNNSRTDGTAGALIAGRGSAEYEQRDAIEIAERAMGRPLTPAEVSSYWTAQALQFIRSQPAQWMRLMGRKTALLWNSYEAFDTESQESHAEWSAPLRLFGWIGHFGVLVPLACFGGLMAWSERRNVGVLYALIAVYAASVVMFFIYARYRYPLVPFLIVFAAAGLVRAAAFVRTRPRQEVAAASVAVAVLAAFTNWPLAASETRAVTEHNLGAALQSDGQLDAAIAHYRRAIEIDPAYAPAYSNMGAALLAGGDFAGAVTAYQRALDIRPDFPDAHFNLGNALLRNGRPEAAIPHFEEAIAGAPETVDARTNLGVALTAAGRTDEGVVALQRAVALAENSAEAHRALGDALDRQGHPDGARLHLERAVALAPSDGRSRHALGRLLIEQEQMPAAIEHLRIAALQTPAPEIHNDLGIALAATGRLDEAIEQFSQALQLDPGSAEARRNLAAATAERQAPGRN
jgi:tetratricopeptide (TPR) repeat protein